MNLILALNLVLLYLLPPGDSFRNKQSFGEETGNGSKERYLREFAQRRHRHKHGEFLPEDLAEKTLEKKLSQSDMRNLIAEVIWSEEKDEEIHWPVKKEAVVEGDLILGGLMMVHEREDSVTCGPVMPQGGIQALETMLYSLDVINNSTFLPSIRLGAHILDDCDKDTYGLEMAVDFIKGINRSFFFSFLLSVLFTI